LLGWFAPALAAEPPSLEKQILGLCDKVLKNSGDRKALSELEKLRQQYEAQRREALDALAEGLGAYISGAATEAHRELKKAMESSCVVEMANKTLLESLDKIAEKCKPSKICNKCGNTGWADCPAKGCDGVGVVKCRNCRGTGSTGRRAPLKNKPYYNDIDRCYKCNGSGSVECPNPDCRPCAKLS